MKLTYVVVYKEADEIQIAHIKAENYEAAKLEFKTEYKNVLPIQMYVRIW